MQLTSFTRTAQQLDLKKGMMDCLYAECIPCITDCVMAELEKLGQQYRVALKVAKVCVSRPQPRVPRFAVTNCDDAAERIPSRVSAGSARDASAMQPQRHVR